MRNLYHDGCTCYFQHETDPGIRICARRGVHEVWCPCYRRSLDPVDYMADEEFKAQFPVVRELIARERRESKKADGAIEGWMRGHSASRS